MSAMPVPVERRPIMVVDDDDAIRDIIGTILRLEGYPVVKLGDGEEALRRMRSGLTPSIILLDLRMPGMDGRTFIDQKNEDPRLAPIPIVILSGDRDGPDIAQKLGIQCLMKPIELQSLLSIVRNATGGPDAT
jgi:CheY-like chemotaxis protein